MSEVSGGPDMAGVSFLKDGLLRGKRRCHERRSTTPDRKRCHQRDARYILLG